MKKTLALLVIFLCPLTQSGYSFDLGTGRGAAIGTNVMLSALTPSEALLFPSGWQIPGRWRLETGFIRTFDMKELDQGFIAAAVKRGAFSLVGGLSQLGQRDFYAEQSAKGAVMYGTSSLTMGATVSALRYSFGSKYPAIGAAGIGGAVGWHRGRLLFSLAGDNLNSPKLYDGAESFRPIVIAQTEIATSTQLSTLAKVALQDRERPRFGLGQRIGLGNRNALMWGFSTAPTIYGGGLELWFGKLSINFAASYHPVLGLSQTVAISIGSGTVRQEGVHDVPDR